MKASNRLNRHRGLKMRANNGFSILTLLFLMAISGCSENNYGSRVEALVPAAPENISATPLIEGIKLNWSAVDGVENYKLYRCPIDLNAVDPASACGAGIFPTCDKALVETEGVSFTDESATPGESYCYFVEACNSVEKCSAPSPTVPGNVDGNVLTVKATGSEFAVARQMVSLSASVHSAEGEITYSWTQTQGIPVVLINSDTVAPSFQAPAVTEHQNLSFSVEVMRGGQTASSEIQISIQPANIFVSAGEDRRVSNGDKVSLHAKGRGEGTVASYSWRQIEGASVVLGDSDTANPYFVAPSLRTTTTLIFEIQFSDGIRTASDKVAIVFRA